MPIRRRPTRSPERIAFARNQRQTANEFARDIWQLLRGRRLLGEKFRREHPMGPYTLDFVCLDLKLDIEIDGADHQTEEGKTRDQRRDAYLRQQGFEVLRIDGYRVTQNMTGVREEIEAVVKRLRGEGGGGAWGTPHPQPLSPLEGRGEPGYCCVLGVRSVTNSLSR